MRNWLTKKVCDFMLQHVATPDYGHKLDTLIKQGLFHADTGEGPYLVHNDYTRSISDSQPE